jgi:hypothetical protein
MATRETIKESETKMSDEERLREQHRRQAYKLVAIRALEKVMREHIIPRMTAEATDKDAVKFGLDSVDSFLRSWRAQEQYSEDRLAQKLAFGLPPDEWPLPGMKHDG